jgi:hypothetical protein
MVAKTKLAKLYQLAMEHEKSTAGRDFGSRFKEAADRGFVLCRDGVERTQAEWLAYLPEETRAAILGAELDENGGQNGR